MADLKISQLPAATTSTAPDLYTLVQGGANKSITFAALQAALGSSSVASLNSLTGALNIVAGANITVTPSGSSITIASTGGGISALTGDVIASGTGSVAAAVAFVGTSSAVNVHAAELLANAATNLNTVSAIVKRDASGNFSAGTITATLSGTATNSTNSTHVSTNQVFTNASFYLTFVASSTNGNQAVDLGTGLTFNPFTNTLSTTTFVGDLTGNASTVTTNANLSGPVTSVGNATAIANGALTTRSEEHTSELQSRQY